MLITLLLLAVLTISSVSANDNLTDDELQADSSAEIDISDDADIISSTQDEIVKGTDNGTFTALQNKISEAEKGSTITLENDYTYDDGFSTTGITIFKSLTIDGKGYTIDANSKGRIFYIAASNVVLKNITFINGYASYYGGAINNTGANVTVDSCTFTNCSAAIGGGAIFNDGANFTVDDCTFTNCSASAYGGAIYNYNGANFTVDSCTFNNCSAGYGGGAIMNNNGANFTVDSCTFNNCSANLDGGGAIYNTGANFTVNSSNFTNCSTTYYGGAIYNNNGANFTVDSCTFNNCSGAIYNRGNNCTVNSCTFNNCSGAIYNRGNNCTVNSCTFTDCYVSGSRVIYNKDGNCTAIKCNFPDLNESEAGYNVTFINCTFKASSSPKATVTTVSINPSTVYVNNTVVITPSVTCDGNVIDGSVDILVNGVKLTSVSIGSSYNYVPTNTGKYTITASFTATDDYNASVSDSVILTVNNNTVTKVSTSLTASKVTATYGVSKKLTITLKDANGNILTNKKVTVNVGSISKTLTTDSNGQVSVDVSTLVPKTYSATIKFTGDDSYTASSKSVSVVVKKATPKITAKAKTFKKKVKTKKYSITLKNNLNKVMKSTKVTIKVNKKTYTAKTNAKGVATFKIKKLTKKGTFKSTIIFKGNSYYNKVTKNVKIKIK